MSTIRRLHPGPRMSEATIHGGVVYLAGQVAEDPSGDVIAQTRQVLAAIDRLLGEAGSSRSSMLSATIFLADINDFQAMNSVWDTWVPEGATPARATIQALLAAPQYKVEIKIVAAQD